MPKKKASHTVRKQTGPTDHSSVKFYIQVAGQPGSGVTPQMSVKDFVEGSKEQFTRIAEVVEVAGQSLVNRIAKLATKPAECAIEFGISAGGEAGVPFVTKGTVGANFKVTIKWNTKS